MIYYILYYEGKLFINHDILQDENNFAFSRIHTDYFHFCHKMTQYLYSLLS